MISRPEFHETKIETETEKCSQDSVSLHYVHSTSSHSCLQAASQDSTSLHSALCTQYKSHSYLQAASQDSTSLHSALCTQHKSHSYLQDACARLHSAQKCQHFLNSVNPVVCVRSLTVSTLADWIFALPGSTSQMLIQAEQKSSQPMLTQSETEHTPLD